MCACSWCVQVPSAPQTDPQVRVFCLEPIQKEIRHFKSRTRFYFVTSRKQTPTRGETHARGVQNKIKPPPQHPRLVPMQRPSHRMQRLNQQTMGPGLDRTWSGDASDRGPGLETAAGPEDQRVCVGEEEEEDEEDVKSILILCRDAGAPSPNCTDPLHRHEEPLRRENMKPKIPTETGNRGSSLINVMNEN